MIKKEKTEYRHADAVLEGYLAYDDALKGKLPGVIIVHDWWGVGPYVKKRAEQIAGLGYVAFVVDMYGKDMRPKTNEEASKLVGPFRADRHLMRSRVGAGLDELKKRDFADPARLSAIGYCFGGGTVLELARSGADIQGVVSFHGNLDTPHPQDAANIKAKVLVCHGADDPLVPPAQVAAFEDEMRKGLVDWQMITYGGAMHSFTNPGAHDPAHGLDYNAAADKRSWEAMKLFFSEIFGGMKE